MGMFLNSCEVYDAYAKEYSSPYFVDKSAMLEEIIPRIGTNTNYICITRPRRFGKSVMANMIASFFTRGLDSKDIFDHLDIARAVSYQEHLNKHNVISISFNRLPKRCSSYDQYIDRIERKLIGDLIEAYPNVKIDEDDAVWDVLKTIYNADSAVRFVFVLDEWDFIFHRDFVRDKDKGAYIDFLSNLLKDQPYVSFAYMTGILPIAKYSSGSELNMFLEYTMATEEMFSDYFGFTEPEVDKVYEKFIVNQPNPRVTRDGLRMWYNGYHTKSGERVYNPRSVVAALTNNNLGNYWTSAGPYDEIYYYINHNTAAVRDSLALMVSGIPVPAKVREYAATSMSLTTRDEIFSAMVVYGFLSYENGYVSIPNRELMEKFSDMLQKEPSLGYVYQLAGKSEKMLRATLANDTDTMLQILEFAHNTETPLLSYNNETELTAVVNLVYLSARDFYRLEREDKAGTGYVDFIFYPESDRKADCIILELKVDHTVEEAIQQIRDRKYAMKFEGRLGEKPKYTGRILAVGIAYDRKTKAHTCRVEVLREAL
ncbi:MAG: AAA family ATPase [Lachnospiraceae bacterium]|nr:AAA family ATPase [Lachnospiraceae bacterium]